MGSNYRPSIQLSRLEKLFDKWHKTYCNYGADEFIEDGPIDPESWYRKEGVKVLFLLKEPNYSVEQELENRRNLYTDDELLRINESRRVRLTYLNQAYQRLGADGPLGGSFRHIQTLAYGLQSRNIGDYPIYKTAYDNRTKGSEQISFMNLKKTPGGASESIEFKALFKKIKKDPTGEHVEFIKDQIKLLFTFHDLDPKRIIVCCGTGGHSPFDLLRFLYDLEKVTQSGGVLKIKNVAIPVFSTHHPNRAGEVHYRDLMCRYQYYLKHGSML